MIWKKLMTKTFLLGLVLGALLSLVIVSGCTGDAPLGASPDPDRTTVGQDISEPESGDSGGEHDSRLEGSESREEGSGGSEHGFGGEGSSTGSEGGVESREAAMSSPITPLGNLGTVSSADWLFPRSTTRQLNPYTPPYETPSPRRSATYRPNLT